MLHRVRLLLSGLLLLTLCALPPHGLADDFHSLNYDIYWQKDYWYQQGYASNPWPGIYLKPKPSTVWWHGQHAAVSLQQHRLETPLKAVHTAALYGVCHLQEFGVRQQAIPEDTLQQKYERVTRAVHGDWDGDGRRDLFFLVQTQVGILDKTPPWCGYQLMNLSADQPPQVKAAVQPATSTNPDPYGFGNVDRLEARDVDGDGRDDLILHYGNGARIPATVHHANQAGELFGAGSWQSAYVPPATVGDGEVPEADVLPRVVGATSGSHAVGTDGMASYTIPIVAPQAAGGQQPGLAISYHGAGGNGKLGFGWQLSGLSRIHRCGKSLRQDGVVTGVAFTSDDQLCLDGQRLVLVAGTHGENGSEYRLENDVLLKVVVEGGTALGTVTAGPVGKMPDRDGSTSATPAGIFRSYAPDGTVSTYGEIIRGNGANATRALEWALTDVQDRWGNAREYHYQRDDAAGNYRLASVHYGGNRSGEQVLPHTHRVELAYGQRSNPYRGYLAGSTLTNDDLLQTVTVYEQHQRLRFYTLKYLPAAHNNTLYLHSVTECSGKGQCLPPTTFEWATYRPGFDRATAWLTRDSAGGRAVVSNSEELVPNEVPQHEFLLDLNGDARADRIWRPAQNSNGSLFVALSNGRDAFELQPAPWLDATRLNVSTVSLRGVRETFGDMNGDGRPDYIWQPSDQHNRIYVALNNGQGFDAPYEALRGTSGLKLFWSVDATYNKDNGRHEAFIDLTGDGRPDKIWRPEGKNDYYIARANAQGKFDTPVVAYLRSSANVASFSYQGARETYVDVTGDGYPDKVWFPRVQPNPLVAEYESGKRLYVAVNLGDGTFGPGRLWLSKADADGFSTIHEQNPGREGYADLNADGLADRFWLLGSPPNSRLYVALSNGRDAFLEPEVWLKDHSLGGINIHSDNSKSRYFMDVNDDGYPDYVWRPSDSDQSLYVALSTGSAFMAPKAWLTKADAGYRLSSSSNVYEWFADVDGDGLPDRVWVPNDGATVAANGGVYQLSGGTLAVSRNLAQRASELVAVRNGFGHETRFDYAPLTDASVYTQQDAEVGGPLPQRPLVVDARRVVKAVETSNGIGGYQRTTYHYAGARFNTATRQFLGFGKITVTNATTGLADVTLYSQDDAQYTEGLILRTYTAYRPTPDAAPVLLSDTRNEWDVVVNQLGEPGDGIHVQNVLPGNKRLVRRLNTTQVTRRDLSGSVLHSEHIQYTYDAYARIDVQTTRVSDHGNAVLKTTTVDNDYATPDTARWILGLPSRITLTEDATAAANPATGDDPPPAVKVTEWDYINGSELKTETIRDGAIAERTTTFNGYDRFGQPLSVTHSARGVAEQRTERSHYDPTGRFAIGGTNALGQPTGTAEYASASDGFAGGAYPGLLRKATDANGIETVYRYDGFGRTVHVASGAKAGVSAAVAFTDTAFLSCKEAATRCPPLAVYAIRTTRRTGANGEGGSVTSTAYLDLLGREVRTVATGPLGGEVVVDRVYDARGNLERVSDPYFAGTSASPVWNTMHYDVLDRPIRTTREVDGREDTTTYDGLVVTRELNVHGGPQDREWRREVRNALGQVYRVDDAQGASLLFSHDSAGRVTRTRAPGNVDTVVRYDALGRKQSMTDPDKGTWAYGYNGFGELVWQRNGNGQHTCLRHDALGRLTDRFDGHPGEPAAGQDCAAIGSEQHARWRYGTAAPEQGLLLSSEIVGSGDGYRETRRYDALGRLEAVTRSVRGEPLVHETRYDDWSRPAVTVYPSGLAVRTEYNAQGHPHRVVDASNGRLYHAIEAMDAQGRVTEERFGNGVTTARHYDDAARERRITTGKGAIRAQAITARYNGMGSLIGRADDVQGYTETFTYDETQRLTQVRGDFGHGDLRTQTQQYDLRGNLRLKEATGTVDTPADAISHIGHYTYGGSSACPAIASVNTLCRTGDSAAFRYDANGNLLSGAGKHITYTAYDLPARIETATASSEIRYTPERQRYWRQDHSGGTTVTTLQVDGLYEKVTTVTGTQSAVEERHYLGTAAVVTLRQRGTPQASTQVRYLHRDVLGSPTAITDETGQVAELQLYDAWGRRTVPNPRTLLALQSANGWAGAVQPRVAAAGSAITPRGYTGHEMFDAVGIIHMNGRIYDPQLGRFLQADPVVQSPTDLQAYNRFAYVRNNPLTLTDPSGYSWLGDLFDDAFDVYKRIHDPFGVGSRLNEVRKDMWRSVGRVFAKVPELQIVVTAVVSVVTCGTGFWIIAAMNAAITGSVTYHNGGSFGDITGDAATAFAASAIWYGTGSALEHFGANLATRVATHAMVGGAISKAQGGSFRDGAIAAGFGQWAGQQATTKWEKLAASAMAGGVSAELSGGKFSQGFVTAGVAHLFNDMMHEEVHKQKTLEVLIAEPTGWGGSSFGHAALAVDGTVYSFSDAGMTILPLDEYLAANKFRSMVGHELVVTEAQVNGVVSLLSGFNEAYSVLKFSTCVQPVVYALTQSGYNVGAPIFPVSLGNAVLDTGRVSRSNFYPQSVERSKPWYYPTESAPWAR